jgi:hypothetical protein
MKHKKVHIAVGNHLLEVEGGVMTIMNPDASDNSRLGAVSYCLGGSFAIA